ncbi:hypothetical protein QBC46DRAFT_395844 [Diplogelasinospora grovesii]|uniref:Uncharacterized protein n=1 Tax=Diplogelasinospora grovesii TaxID=303347 RepID=A0AAN6MZ13_9PEZI|nr:hypothetical protein QBC46DRAFT_395844 [Diplogelasinospora grovesii]
MNRNKYQEIGSAYGIPNNHPAARQQRGCGYYTKIILRLLSILLCIGVIATQVATVIQIQQEYHRVADVFYFTVPPCLLAIAWDKLEFIVSCCRRGRGIHPGAHVGVNLILWLGFFGVGGNVLRAAGDIASISAQAKDYLNSSSDGTDTEGDYNGFTWDDVQVYDGYAVKGRVAGALLCLIGLIRFVLFVIACIDTDRRRKAKRMARSVVVVEPHRNSVASIPLTNMSTPQPYDPVTMIPPSHPPPQYYEHAGKQPLQQQTGVVPCPPHYNYAPQQQQQHY